MKTPDFYKNQVKSFKADSIEEMEAALNGFYSEDKFIIATQIFPIKKGKKNTYEAMVYFKVPPKRQNDTEEPSTQRSSDMNRPQYGVNKSQTDPIKATDAQKAFLKTLGYEGDTSNLTKAEAHKLIQERTKRQQ